MRRRVCKEGEDKFWKLNCLDALVINRSGAAAADGWTEETKIGLPAKVEEKVGLSAVV